jgi:MarR family transcriptional regulator, temperature-dependent positive regulator of motility
MDSTGAQTTPEPLRTAPGFLVRRLYQAYTAAWARHVDPVLTGPQYAVLTAVSAYPEVDQGSLAAVVALDRSTMADVCRRLEDRGLISRTVAPSDGRRKLLGLTALGAEVLDGVAARVGRLEGALMRGEGLDPDDDELLLRLELLSRRWETVCDAEGT